MQVQTDISTAQPQAPLTSGVRSGSCRTPAGSIGAASSGTTASISSQSSLIQNGSATAPSVRMDKVQSVQAALASGSYKVDAGKVADKLMESLLSR